MIDKLKLMLVALVGVIFPVSAQNPDTLMTKTALPSGPVVDIRTTKGDIRVKLYDDTPKHRDNFVKLAREGYYDGVLFHRVIKDFMVQTGDPDSKTALPGAHLGSGGPDYQVDAEIIYPKYYHKYGALAAARSGDNVNPRRKSSGSQFYIVTGKKYPGPAVQSMAQKAYVETLNTYFGEWLGQHQDLLKDGKSGTPEGRKEIESMFMEDAQKRFSAEIPQDMLATYATLGGTPFLDGQYTVFGEVLSGMDVVEQIQNQPTDSNDRPSEDVKIISVTVEE